MRNGMCNYLKINPAKLHPDTILNDRALGLFWQKSPQQEEQQEQDQ